MRINSVKKYILLTTVSFLSLFLSLILIFVGGATSNETVVDDIANYTADIVQKHTKSGTYLGTIVEPFDDKSNLPDAVHEFNNLYGVFRQEKATFGSLFNADKKVEISLSETESSSLSIFCLGPNGTKAYKKHYIHYIYPFEMLFEDESYYDKSKYIAYLSTSQADGILANRGITPLDDEYILDQYRTLLGTKTIINFDGSPFEYVIGNVFIETNYYYDCFKETVGNFFLTSYFAPDNVSKQHMYFLTSYVYQNKFFMKHLNDVYDSSYKISFSTLNFEGHIDSDHILSFRTPVKMGLEAVFIVSCIVSVLLSSLGYYLFYVVQKSSGFAIYISHLTSLFAPYLIFKFLFVLFKNIYFFSTVSTIANAILVIFGLAAYSFIYFKTKKSSRIKFAHVGWKHYEVNI